MKKHILLFIIVLVSLVGCNHDDIDAPKELNLPDTFRTDFARYILLKDTPRDTISSFEYRIIDGKVMQERYRFYLQPYYSQLSDFEFDAKGRVVLEKVGNVVKYKVIWNDSIATVFNANQLKVFEFVLNNNLISKASFFEQHGAIVWKKTFRYSSYGNVIASENVSGKKIAEYLNYDTTVVDPNSLLQSINILRFTDRPYSKNIFSYEKVYSHQGDDYSVPETTYHYFYSTDLRNRVVEMHDEKTVIYSIKFRYF